MTYQLLIATGLLTIVFTVHDLGFQDLIWSKKFLELRLEILGGQRSTLERFCEEREVIGSKVRGKEGKKRKKHFLECKTSVDNRHSESLCAKVSEEKGKIRTSRVFLSMVCRYSNPRLGVNKTIIKRFRSQVGMGSESNKYPSSK